jgi:serine/threonine-protein kinase Chk2
MHRINIIHRDIKPQNILMTDKDVLMVCVADLGLAIKDYDIKCRTEQCGTPGYVDPEVLNG